MTVAEFRRFVNETDHLRSPSPPDAADYLTPIPSPVAGSWSSTAPRPGRSGRLPELVALGSGRVLASSRRSRSTGPRPERHPVTHVTAADAEAYASWAGKELPSEAEWECAARGGLEGKIFVWGDEFAPKGRMMANTWQGEFPWQNLLTTGTKTSPVASFPPNRYGLFDMAGNVWQWTSTGIRTMRRSIAPCCTAENPRGLGLRRKAANLGIHAASKPPRKVIKGGSFLALPAIARDTGPPRVWRRPLIPPHAMSASAVSCENAAKPYMQALKDLLASAKQAATFEIVTATPGSVAGVARRTTRWVIRRGAYIAVILQVAPTGAIMAKTFNIVAETDYQKSGGGYAIVYFQN